MLVIALAGGGSYAAYTWRPAKKHHARGAGTVQRTQRSLLIGIRSSTHPNDGAQSLALFVRDRDGSHPLILFLPVRTLGQTPGEDAFGPISDASTPEDRISLEALTVENVFGLRVDSALSLDDVQFARAIDAVGGIGVDVQESVPPSGGAQPFAQGLQKLSGARALDYLAFGSSTDTEVRRFVRSQKVWEGLLSKAPAVLTNAFAPGSGAETAFLARFLHDMALFASVPADARTYDVAPVTPVLAGGKDEAYQLIATDLDDMIKRDFPTLMLGGVVPDARPKIELRNGAGKPGLGKKVARIILPHGIKVEVAGNASNFDYEGTLIIVYSQDELALGRKIRDLLSVGEVELAASGQTVVDVTVILGKDLARRS